MNNPTHQLRRVLGGGAIAPRRSPNAPGPNPPLRGEVAAMPGQDAGPPPDGRAWIYELTASPAGEPFYVGQTCQDPRARLSRHLGLARRCAGRNPAPEVRLRGMAERGETLVLRLVDLQPAGEAATGAERSRIIALRERLGTGLLNLHAQRPTADQLADPEPR